MDTREGPGGVCLTEVSLYIVKIKYVKVKEKFALGWKRYMLLSQFLWHIMKHLGRLLFFQDRIIHGIHYRSPTPFHPALLTLFLSGCLGRTAYQYLFVFSPWWGEALWGQIVGLKSTTLWSMPELEPTYVPPECRILLQLCLQHRKESNKAYSVGYNNFKCNCLIMHVHVFYVLRSLLPVDQQTS